MTIKNKKIWLISSLLMLAIGATTFTWYISRGQGAVIERGENTVDYKPASRDQEDAGNTAKQNTIDLNTDKSNNVKTPTSSESINNDSPVVTITSLSASHDTLLVRAMIDRLSLSGGCEIRVLNGGEVIAHERADVQPVSSYSTCKGFNLSVKDSMRGNMVVEVTYRDQDGSVSSAQGDVFIP